MAVQVYIAHTGKRLVAEPGTFASLDAFKAWVAEYGAVSVQNQICLTAQGKAVRAQTLLTEQEIFVYDRRVSSSTSTVSYISQIPVPKPYEVERPPDTISDQNDLQAWQNLFMSRRSWALKLVDDCARMSNVSQLRYAEIDVIARSMAAAHDNLRGHVESLDQKFAGVQTWASDLIRDNQASEERRQEAFGLLRSIPVTSAMVRFIVGRDPRRGKAKASLEDLIVVEEVQKADSLARPALKHFKKDFIDLGNDVNQLIILMDEVSDKVENGAAVSAMQRSSESLQLMEDIEAIAKKVSNDYENVLTYSNTPKSVSQASKSALLHTKNFLPNLSKRSLEMDGIVRYATESRNNAAAETIDIMQGVGKLNTMCTELIAKMDALDLTADEHKALELLSLVDKLPIIYASFVAEAIRRREWNEKIRSDSSTLANEMATFQDEEERRRKKWQRTTGILFGFEKQDRKAMGLEVNLLGEEEQWPQASRQDLEQLMDILQTQDTKADLKTEVAQIISDLNSPTKQQHKRVKAFKNGSFHEAALGRSTLLVRGDDDLVRSLQIENAKMESRLKGSESRIRKLEGLLHQQGHVSRTSTGNVFQFPSSLTPDRLDMINPLASPHLLDSPSRRSSVSSRRFSANQGAEEKAMAQKLISMEAELIAERERVAGLEKEVSARTTATNEAKGQIQEANSTKKDLMENLEAQQREFAMERLSLENEIKRLKEEYEEDLDRFIGSRENEKASVDERVSSLTNELERIKSERLAETQKAQGQLDFLRNDAKLQREANETLREQLQRHKEDTKEYRLRAEGAEAAGVEHLVNMKELHAVLSPTYGVPNDMNELVEVLLSRSRDVVSQLEVHQRDLVVAQSDREAAHNLVSDLRSELTVLREKLNNEELETFRLRETLGGERAKFGALQAELHDERGQLSLLRAKFADGETGPEALQSRVAEEERKVTSLSEELATKRSQVGSLEEELRSVQDRLQASLSKLEKLTSRFEVRTMRAKDLTQRLYSQNDRLCRLLDRLSYSVTREGDSMIITRIPRQERSNANDSSDPGSSMRRSISGAAGKKAMADSGDLDLLYWMQNDDSETESEKYDAYLQAIGNFDVEAFCETMLRRVKDLEHTARKYTKDARMYREKSHAAQKEAHEKIAFKHFKEGDLALFLPTRNQATGAWAAFNVGAPHYFLREQDSHHLRTRDWLLARIHKISPRVVDLSKPLPGPSSTLSPSSAVAQRPASIASTFSDDDNPFDLSDGLRWYLLDAAEEKPGAPSTPGQGKSTVATAPIDATGSIRRTTKKSSSGGVDGVSKTLTKSLDSRRSSTTSKKTPHGPSTPKKAPASLTDLTPAPATPTEPADGLGISTPNPQQPPQLLSATSSNLENLNSTNSSPGKNPTGAAGAAAGRSSSVIWDSLWSLDVSVESGRRGGK